MTPDELRPALSETIQQTDEKPWWQSRTIWGSIIVVVAQLGRLVEIDVDVEGLTDAVLSIATLLGAVMAWWGRMQAAQPVSRAQVLPGVRAR